jgi:acetyl esterase/lipase
MRNPMTRVVVFLCLLAGVAPPAVAQVDQQRAQEFFKEAQALCERDDGRLWGVSICAPMVIADARTQTFATSQPLPEEARPRVLGIVNAPVQWGGATWAAYIWDDVAHRTPRGRRELLLHELFHGVQPRLGLVLPARATEHLDAMDGRYWLRLEWRALARALRESGEPRNLAVRDALAFRQARRAVYPGSVEDERAQEITEGLAAYTGTVLAAPSAADAIASAIENLTVAENTESFVRTFAYSSGPAYGLLLDASSPGWTRRVRGRDDLGTLVMRALAVHPAADAAASAARYGGAEIRASEQQRDEERQQRLAELRQRFVDGPALVIPGGGSGMSDSRGATVIPGIGTVYFGPYRASGSWGALEAEKGVLVASDGRSRRVSAPVRRDDGTFAGDGWTFRAAAGWVIREGERRGDYEVVRQPEAAPARQPSVTTDVVYGHKDGLALTFDVHRPAKPNGAGVIAIVSGGYQSSVEMSRLIVDGYLAPLLNEKGFTVFAVRHGSSPRYPMSAIVADLRRAVRFIRQHGGEHGIDPDRIGVYGGSAGGHLALLLGTTPDSGDPSASDATLRESSRVAAVVANFPPTDLSRFANRRSIPATAALTEAEAAQYSPIHFVSLGAAPSLIVHGDADEVVPIVEGEAMYEALTKAGVISSFIRIEGAGHAFEGADLERVNAAMVQWFERHLGSAAK